MNSIIIDEDSCCVISSFEDFYIWITKYIDLNIFGEDEVKLLLEEIKPVFYPCVLLRVNNLLDIIYFKPEQIKLMNMYLDRYQFEHHKTRVKS